MMLIAIMTMLQAGAPLIPIDTWSVSQSDGMCIMSRPFGDRASPIVLAIRQTPLDDDGATIIIVEKTPPRDPRFPFGGKVKVVLTPGEASEEGRYDVGTMNEPGRRFVIFAIERATLEAMPRSTAMAVKLDREPLRTFPLATIAGTRGALRQCDDALLTRWGIDPGERDRVATRAIPRRKNNAGGFQYPTDAINRKERGTATVAWRVTDKGLVADCRVVQSSGSMSLDRASCVGVRGLGPYTPATGQDGKAMASYKVTRVNWVLPRM